MLSPATGRIDLDEDRQQLELDGAFLIGRCRLVASLSIRSSEFLE